MKRVLVVYFSQSGQVAEIVRSITTPLMQDPSIEVLFERLEPLHPYPFPWPFFQFAGVMPESVLMEPPPIKPFRFDPKQAYDLVVLAYQPWYLSPSPPITAFLKEEATAKLLCGKPVITVIGCRGMWLMAQEKIKKILQDLGARLLDNIVLTDRGGMAVSLVTTVRRVFTGKKGKFLGVFPPAGVAEKEVEEAERFGLAIRKALQTGILDIGEPLLKGYGAVRIDTRLIGAERVGHRVFLFWARIIKAVGPPGSWRNKASLLGFYLSLLLGIAIVLPWGYVVRPILALFLKERLKRQRAYYEWPSGSDTFHLT